MVIAFWNFSYQHVMVQIDVCCHVYLEHVYDALPYVVEKLVA